MKFLWFGISILMLPFLAGCEGGPTSKDDLGQYLKEAKVRIETEKKGLTERYSQLEIKVRAIQADLEAKKTQGLDKINEVQSQLEEAQEAFEQTQAALEKLNDAGQALSESFDLKE